MKKKHVWFSACFYTLFVQNSYRSFLHVRCMFIYIYSVFFHCVSVCHSAPIIQYPQAATNRFQFHPGTMLSAKRASRILTPKKELSTVQVSARCVKETNQSLQRSSTSATAESMCKYNMERMFENENKRETTHLDEIDKLAKVPQRDLKKRVRICPKTCPAPK